MRNDMKIAVALISVTFLGLAGCATDAKEPDDDTTPGSLAMVEERVEDTSLADDVAPLMSMDATVNAERVGTARERLVDIRPECRSVGGFTGSGPAPGGGFRCWTFMKESCPPYFSEKRLSNRGVICRSMTRDPDVPPNCFEPGSFREPAGDGGYRCIKLLEPYCPAGYTLRRLPGGGHVCRGS